MQRPLQAPSTAFVGSIKASIFQYLARHLWRPSSLCSFFTFFLSAPFFSAPVQKRQHGREAPCYPA